MLYFELIHRSGRTDILHEFLFTLKDFRECIGQLSVTLHGISSLYSANNVRLRNLLDNSDSEQFMLRRVLRSFSMTSSHTLSGRAPF